MAVAYPTPDRSMHRTHLEDRLANFDLSWTAAEGDHGLMISLEYNTDLFDRVTIERLSGHFDRVLASIVEDPGRVEGADDPRDAVVHGG